MRPIDLSPPPHVGHYWGVGIPPEPPFPTLMAVTVRIVVILLAVAGISGHVAYLDALWWQTLDLTTTRLARGVGGATLLLLIAHAIVSAVCSFLAVYLVLHEGRRASAARALAVAFGSWSYLMAYSGVTLLLRPVSPGLTREIFEAHFLLVEVVGLAALLRYTAIFPRPLTEEELRPWATLPSVLLPFHHLAVFMRRPWAPWLLGALVLAVLWTGTLLMGGELSDAGLSPAMDVVRLGAAGFVVVNLNRSWRVSTEGDRDALTWIAAALTILLGSLAVLIGGNILVAVTGFPEPDVAWRPILLDGGTIGFFVCLAWSALDPHGADPARTVRRATTITVVVTCGLILAAGLEALFTGAIFTSYALRTGVGTAAAFAVVLATFRTSSRAIERVLPI